MQMNFAAYRLIGKFIFAVLCLWTFKNIFFSDTKMYFVIIFNTFKMQQPVAMPSVNEYLLGVSVNVLCAELFAY